MTGHDPAEARCASRAAANIPPAALRKRLAPEDGDPVGPVPGKGLKAEGAAGGSVGRHVGARILGSRSTRQVALPDADPADMHPADMHPADMHPSDIHPADMHKVVGDLHRHMTRQSEGNVSETKGRGSLMNRGHDPLKPGSL